MEQQLCDRAIRLSCHPTSKEKFTAAGPRCEATPKTLFDPRWLRSDLKADTLRHSGCCSGGVSLCFWSSGQGRFFLVEGAVFEH